VLCPDFAEKGADRLSDESSKKADSDSHPENWTDHEYSDPQQPAASSPPKGSEDKNKVKYASQQDSQVCVLMQRFALVDINPCSFVIVATVLRLDSVSVPR
jgi:hypothetical protein